jgi:hypothetical protein
MHSSLRKCHSSQAKKEVGVTPAGALEMVILQRSDLLPTKVCYFFVGRREARVALSQ